MAESALETRRHPLADCGNCDLNRPGTAFVPSRGPSGEALLAVVGEAPGYKEASEGKPFVGPSGKLLDVVLRQHGIDTGNVFYTNTCLCRPEGNATPSPQAVRACSNRLKAELADSGAPDILALGGTATEVLYGKGTRITQARVGPPRESPVVPGKRVVATWHPAYTLRHSDAFPTLLADVGKLVDTRVSDWEPPKWKAYDDVESAHAVIEALKQYKQIVVDIECGIEKDISFEHPSRYKMLSVGICYERDRAVVIGETALEDKSVCEALGQYLRASRVIAHNGKFDVQGLQPILGIVPLWADTMLASYALDSRTGGHGLKSLAIERLGAPDYEQDVKQYVRSRSDSYANIPRPILYRYNAYDVACTWRLWELFEPLMDKKDVRRVHDLLIEAANQLVYIELNGVGFDLDRNRELHTEYLENLTELEKQLEEIVCNEEVAIFNPRSPVQVKAFFLREGIRTDTTNADFLEGLLGQTLPDTTLSRFAKLMLLHRRTQKLYGTYITGMRRKVYRRRVFTTYSLHGTSSGRLASKNPNLQNVVRDNQIRSQFVVTDPDNVLIHADYKQVEGRVMAWLAQDEYLADIFRDPTRDLFDELGSGIYNKPASEITKNQRVRTKAYFYGLGYGRTPFSIAMEHDLPVLEVERDVARFKGTIPGIVEWQAGIKKRIRRGPLVSPFGRRRYFPLITNDNVKDVENEALSFLPQSTASDICLTALVRLRPLLKGLGAIRLTIHDALVVECKETDREGVAALMRKIMVGTAEDVTDYVPFDVDISYGKNWGDL